MMRWFIGVSSAVILGAIGWATTFITMSYQAQADILELKRSQESLSFNQSELKAELRAVKSITERTEKNTEDIRGYLLRKSIK